MSDRFIDEILEIHQFFELWFTGSVEKSKEQFARFEQAFADGFVMILPGGNQLTRDELLEIFWQEYGSISAPFRIEIRNPTVRKVGESLHLAIYEEWQFGQEQTARITSALMSENRAGVQWLSAHETWLPEI